MIDFGDKFKYKWNLMNHRKLLHIQKIALCKNRMLVQEETPLAPIISEVID